MTTDRRIARDDRSRGPRTAQEAKPKDVYYRPEYGWVMSNAQVKEEQGIKGKYDAAATAAAEQVRQNEESYKRAMEQGTSDINSAYDSAIGGSSKPTMDLVPVRVVNGNNIEATYMLTRAQVDSMNKDSFNKGKGSYVGNWVDGGSYNVDVRATGAGVAGQPLHDALRGAADQVAAQQKDNENAYNASIDNANQERDATLAGFESSSAASYAGAQQTWAKELDQVYGSYGARVASGKAAYDDSKKKYSDSVSGVDMGLLESPTNAVKTQPAVASPNLQEVKQ